MKISLLFVSGLKPFISLSNLIALPRAYSIKVNKSGDNGHPHLVFDLGEKALNISLLRMVQL